MSVEQGSFNRERALLFFDDQYLDRRDNLDRRLGQPVPVPEGTWRDPDLDPSWGYPSVFADRESGLWRCLYQAQLPRSFVPEGGRLRHLALAVESEDGVRWRAPDLTQAVPMEGRVRPHQVLPLAGFGEWGPCFHDAHTDNPAERLKAFVSYRDPGGTSAPLYVSADGRAWRLRPGRSWHPTGIDPAVSGFWNPVRDSYVIAARPSWGDRRIAVYETRDWRTFSAPEVAMRPDGEDTPAAQVYGMPVFPYAHLFIGFLWIYHTTPVVGGSKFIGGKVDCQLAYSYNGWHFQRCQRAPFLPNAAPGEPGYGCIYPSSLVVTDDHVIRIYSSSSEGEHAQRLSEPERGEGCLLLHELRLDGFVYLEPAGGPGSLTTRPLYLRGDRLTINVQAPQGRLRVQVTGPDCRPLDGYTYEDCASFTGDAHAWEPVWSGGRTIGALAGQVIRLEVEMFNGRLYALRGDLRPTSPAGLRSWIDTGAAPATLQEA